MTLLWNGEGRGYMVRYWRCDDEHIGQHTVNLVGENSISRTIDDLEEWTSYCVDAAACNSMGCSQFGSVVPDKTRESGQLLMVSNVGAF